MTHTDLMPCPLCGRIVHNDTITLACTGRYRVDDEEDTVDCPYFLDVGAETPEHQSSRDARLAEAHNTLARRAEIGRLVEVIRESTGIIGPAALCFPYPPGGKPSLVLQTAGGPLVPPDELDFVEALRQFASKVGPEKPAPQPDAVSETPS